MNEQQNTAGGRFTGLLVLLCVLLSSGNLIGKETDHQASRPDPLPETATTNLQPQVAAAIRAAEKDVRQHPDSAEHWGQLGMVYDVHSFALEALAAYDTAALLDPTDYRWPYLEAVMLNKHDLERSLAAFSDASRLQPDNPVFQIYYGDALRETGKLTEANQAFEKALSLNPRSPDAHYGLGQCAFLAGELPRAKDHLQQAIALRHDFRQAHILLAQVYQRMGDRAAAKRQQETAANYPKTNRAGDPVLAARSALGVSLKHLNELGPEYMRAGRYADAEGIFHKIIEFSEPVQPMQLVNLGAALTEQGKNTEAIALYRKALTMDSNIAEAHNNLGVVLMREKAWEEAEKHLRKAIELDPRSTDSLVSLGLLYQQHRQPAQAIEQYRKALAINPGSLPARERLAQTLMATGKREEAVKLYREILAVHPNRLSSLHSLALALISTAQHQEAIDLLRKGVRYAPNSSRFTLLLAWELATAPGTGLRNPAEALELARRVAAVYPDDIATLDVLAAAQAAKGDFAAAAETADRAARLTTDSRKQAALLARAKRYREQLPR